MDLPPCTGYLMSFQGPLKGVPKPKTSSRGAGSLFSVPHLTAIENKASSRGIR